MYVAILSENYSLFKPKDLIELRIFSCTKSKKENYPLTVLEMMSMILREPIIFKTTYSVSDVVSSSVMLSLINSSTVIVIILPIKPPPINIARGLPA